MQITLKATELNATDTLECGQVFRFFRHQNGYILISGDKQCRVETIGDTTYIETEHEGYFHHYFDLDTDYGHIIRALRSFEGFEDIRGGIRILRQQLFETIISFIISANNNIPRIKAIIEQLCQRCGNDMGEYYAFPTPAQLIDLKVSDYRAMGAGYRDTYLHSAVKALYETDLLQTLGSMDYQAAIKSLCKIKGVGRKVADCIALFALGHSCCYPVDTWIMKADATQKGDTPQAIRKRAQQKYGNYAGYAQQYKYYLNRNAIRTQQ